MGGLALGTFKEKTKHVNSLVEVMSMMPNDAAILHHLDATEGIDYLC